MGDSHSLLPVHGCGTCQHLHYIWCLIRLLKIL